ncbi:MAG: putative porin [Bacteroidales bacterium]|nr:putative porin [Bacteroidales bacterium]
MSSIGYAQQLPDSTTTVYGWRLENYTVPVREKVDTLLTELHIHNAMYKYSYTNSYLGNLGSPVIQNDFFAQYRDNDFFLIEAYRPYISTYDDIIYYNAKKPFSHLFYTNGDSKRDKEESLDVFHARNINQKSGFGFRYNLYATKGQYLYQDVKRNMFSMFGYYSGKAYQLHIAANVNQYRSSENGGVVDSTYKGTEFRFNKEIPTTLQGGNQPSYEANVKNKLRYIDFMVTHRYKLFKNTSKDSLKQDKKVMAEPVISFVTRGKRTSKIYTDNDPLSNPYYNILYSNLSASLDSASLFELVNTLQLDFKTQVRNKAEIGIFGNINIEHQEYNMHTKSDSSSFVFGENDSVPVVAVDSMREVGKYHARRNVYLSAGLYGNLFGNVTTDFRGKLFLIGDKLGDTELDGKLNTSFKIRDEMFNVSASAKYENIQPGYLYSNYYSNSVLRKNDSLESKENLYLSGSIGSSSNKLRLFADYALLRKHIYFDENTLQPTQIDKDSILTVLRVGGESKLNWWKLHTINKVIVQEASHPDIIPLPQVAFYNTTYFDHTWRFELTNGELRTMLGFELYYDTEFNGYGYNPALSTFYASPDDNTKVGNCPYINIFLNVWLKSVRAFIMAEHVNTEFFKDSNLYSAKYYPQNTYRMKFGVAWTFYD